MIPIYRGELHKVSGVARQWSIPKTQIPLSVFRNALRKRKAAVNEFLQPSAAHKTNGHATPVANGTVETPGPASAGDASREHGKPGGSENDGESSPDDRAENGIGLSGGKPSSSTDRSERVEDEIEGRQERKRRREEDSREDCGRCNDRREGLARRDGGEPDVPSKGKRKVSHEGSELMLVDSPEQVEAMDCDDKGAERASMDRDEIMADQVRVRVSDVGTISEKESKQGDCELGDRALTAAKQNDAGIFRRNGELAHLATGTVVSSSEATESAQIQLPTVPDCNATGAGSAELRVVDETKKKELEAKLGRLRAEKHRFVLRLKQVLHEEEVKKRGSLGTGSPASVQGAVASTIETTGVLTQGDKHGIGASHKSIDLEDGELDYARTPSPPPRAIPSAHGNISSCGTLDPPPLTPVAGRQSSLSQHLSQSASGRDYVQGLGVSPSPAAPGISGGAPSPGVGFMGNLPSLAYQHAAAIHAQKVSSVSYGHGQFSPAHSSGALVGAGLGASGGPPGFSGYPMSASVNSHHSHLSQSASSPLPNIVGQQGVSSSSLLAPRRGPPGYHDICTGGGTWVQR